MKVLMVLTSHDRLGNTGRKTGFWLEEMAAPYYVFKEAGAQITLASPKGGPDHVLGDCGEVPAPLIATAPSRSRGAAQPAGATGRAT
jgi:putative intracellular protease/amidase